MTRVETTNDQAWIVKTVTGFVAEALDVEPVDIAADANLFEQLGMDSIGIVYVHVEMAIEFDLPEPDPSEDLSGYDTVIKLVEYLEAKGVHGR